MDARFQVLPPVKRFRLLQQQQEQEEEFNGSKANSFHLPAKKRKESRDPPVAQTTTYCLPTKKRIWAFQPDSVSGKPLFPFDLNVDYEKEEGGIEENKNSPISKSPKKSVFDAQEEILVENKKISPRKGPNPKSLIKTRKEEEDNKENEIPSVVDKSKKTQLAKSPKKCNFDAKEKNLVESKKIPLENGSKKCMKSRHEEDKQKETLPLDEASEEEKEEFEEEEDGILCDICKSTDGDPTDPIVFCDGCDLMVHSTCYGNPLIKEIPEGDWFCSLCLASKSEKNTGDNKPLSCCLCPTKGGAMKPTNDGRWAHLVCAVLVPEVFFEDPEGRERIDCSKIPEKRWKGKCYVCRSRSGCVIECSEPKCGLEFHVTCGLKEDLCIEYKEGKKGAVVAGFCKCHTELWKKQQQTGKFKIVARDEQRR
ncbi:Zinc finger, PHD-type [Corchorus olitorius]|uniref:Zinc finger, PHD-type n=1 Tax=Corchorus olitorius TaxID=93759 RepID=A0A1R3JCQ4_9ROSI|nr:Zinc finger, PHD-type [Corchorus olitorius]